MSKMFRPFVLLAALALVFSACDYSIAANDAAKNNTPVPWFCNPIAPNSVTGPGMGTIDWYASIPRAPLSYANCKTVAAQLDLAKAYAEQYPTLGDAESAGFISTFAFIPGMGTHHGLGAVTPAMLADPNFNRLDPVIPNSIMDGTFNPAQPEFLQYNGNGPSARLVGMSYYVRTTNGLPPAGFVGNNDRWHHHPQLCMNPATAQAYAVNQTDAQCQSTGGVNLHMQNYYMLHVWLVDDMEYIGDVHAPMHPCIKPLPTGAIFDMNDPCHQENLPGNTAAGADPHQFICPIGTLADQ